MYTPFSQSSLFHPPHAYLIQSLYIYVYPNLYSIYIRVSLYPIPLTIPNHPLILPLVSTLLLRLLSPLTNVRLIYLLMYYLYTLNSIYISTPYSHILLPLIPNMSYTPLMNVIHHSITISPIPHYSLMDPIYISTYLMYPHLLTSYTLSPIYSIYHPSYSLYSPPSPTLYPISIYHLSYPYSTISP